MINKQCASRKPTDSGLWSLVQIALIRLANFTTLRYHGTLQMRAGFSIAEAKLNALLNASKRD